MHNYTVVNVIHSILVHIMTAPCGNFKSATITGIFNFQIWNIWGVTEGGDDECGDDEEEL